MINDYLQMFKETMTINMTIWDTDDEMPQFQNQDSNSNCVVPVYKAGASEDYLVICSHFKICQ